MIPIRELKKLERKPQLDPLDHYCVICDKYFAKPLYRWHLKHHHDVVHPAIYALLCQYGVYYPNYGHDNEGIIGANCIYLVETCPLYMYCL